MRIRSIGRLKCITRRVIFQLLYNYLSICLVYANINYESLSKLLCVWINSLKKIDNAVTNIYVKVIICEDCATFLWTEMYRLMIFLVQCKLQRDNRLAEHSQVFKMLLLQIIYIYIEAIIRGTLAGLVHLTCAFHMHQKFKLITYVEKYKP